MVEAIEKYAQKNGLSKPKGDSSDITFKDIVNSIGASYAGETIGNTIEGGIDDVAAPYINGVVDYHAAAGVSSETTEQAIKSMTFSSKAVGKGMAFGASTLLGVGIDMAQGDTAQEAWGKEITVGATTAAISGSVALGSALLTAVGVIAAPVTLGVGATIALGTIVNLGNEWARQKFPEVKEFEDNIGKGVVDTWNSGVDKAKKVLSW